MSDDGMSDDARTHAAFPVCVTLPYRVQNVRAPLSRPHIRITACVVRPLLSVAARRAPHTPCARPARPPSALAAPDHQLNLNMRQLEALVGAATARRVAIELPRDFCREASSARAADGAPLRWRLDECPAELFLRVYSSSGRPWIPFHVDRSAVTVNVALSADEAHSGGLLVAAPVGGAVCAISRAEGEASVHDALLLHGVSRVTRGARYSLIVFIDGQRDETSETAAATAEGRAAAEGRTAAAALSSAHEAPPVREYAHSMDASDAAFARHLERLSTAERRTLLQQLADLERPAAAAVAEAEADLERARTQAAAARTAADVACETERRAAEALRRAEEELRAASAARARAEDEAQQRAQGEAAAERLVAQLCTAASEARRSAQSRVLTGAHPPPGPAAAAAGGGRAAAAAAAAAAADASAAASAAVKKRELVEALQAEHEAATPAAARPGTSSLEFELLTALVARRPDLHPLLQMAPRELQVELPKHQADVQAVMEEVMSRRRGRA